MRQIACVLQWQIRLSFKFLNSFLLAYQPEQAMTNSSCVQPFWRSRNASFMVPGEADYTDYDPHPAGEFH